MSAPTGCYTGIIGLSQRDCDCHDPDGKPIDASTSASGLYLDELEGLNLQQLKAAADCDGLWDMMDRARSSAIKEMQRDLLACISTNTEESRRPVRQRIGDASNSSRTLSLSNTYHGMVIQTADMVGGTMTVYRIGLKMDQTGALDVSVYDRVNSTVIQTYTVPTIAGTESFYTLPTPLVLQMEADYSANPRYYFLFQPGGMKAHNVRFHCGCSGGGWKPNWSDGSPTYESANRNDGFAWAQWVMAAGTKGNDLTTRETWAKSSETQGMILDASFACDPLTTICGGPEGEAVYTDDLMLAQAYAVLLLAGVKLLTMIQASSDPSFWTLLNADGVAAFKQEYTSKYKEIMQGFLCEQFPLEGNINRFGDCRKCKDPYGMKVSRIKA